MKITRTQLRKLIEVYVVTPEGEAHDARSRYKEKIEPEMKAAHPGLKRLADKIDPHDQHVSGQARGTPEAERYSDSISQPYSLYTSMTDDDVDAAVLDHETEHPERGMHYDAGLETDHQSANHAMGDLSTEIDSMGFGLDSPDFDGWDKSHLVQAAIAKELARRHTSHESLEVISDYIDNAAFMNKYALPLYDSPVAQQAFIDIVKKAYHILKRK